MGSNLKAYLDFGEVSVQDAGTSEGARKGWLKRERAKKAEEADALVTQKAEESDEGDEAKSLASKIEKAFEEAGLKGWGGVDVYIDGDEVQVEGGVDLPFKPVNYNLGKNRGYRDVWEDEAEIDEYKGKFEDAVLGVLDDAGIDYGYETLEWRAEDDGRGESGHKFFISGTKGSGGEVSVQDGAKKRYLAMCQDWSSLEEHDKKYHPGGYKEGDSCKVRENMAKGDAPEKALADAASGSGDTGGSGGGSILDNVNELAKKYVEMSGELRKKINPSHKDYHREKELVDRALDRFMDALKDTPWSAFGDDPDWQDNKLADFSEKLPKGANLDMLIGAYVELDDDAESIYEPADAFEIFVDCHSEDDKTLGDTLKRAVPKIEAKFNERAADERYEEEAERSAWADREAERDAFRYNAPFTAYLEGR